MSKRTVFTTLTSLPVGISRETVLETLHSHVEMIDLNPLVEERHPIKAPAKATPEEFHCIWYSLTDKVSYLPGGLMTGKVTYSACFHDLSNGLQTHCYAPMGLDIKGKWTLGGTLPHEPKEAVEMGLGAPKNGLWLREDVDMRCNILMTSFVKKTLKKAHATLVDRLVEKSHLLEADIHNNRVWETTSNYSYHSNRTLPHSISSPDPSLFSRQSVIGRSGSPGPQPALPSPDPEAHDRKNSSPYPPPSSAWSSPSLGNVDSAYQKANPYAPDPRPVSHSQSSFKAYDPRNNPAATYGRGATMDLMPNQSQSFQAVELPAQKEIAELDSGPAEYNPIPSKR